jgi:hypothetical protein
MANRVFLINRLLLGWPDWQPGTAANVPAAKFVGTGN